MRSVIRALWQGFYHGFMWWLPYITGVYSMVYRSHRPDPIGGKSELMPFSLAHKEWAVGSIRGEKVENVKSEENRSLKIGSKLE